MSGRVLWPGLVALALVAALTLGAAAVVGLRAEEGVRLGAADWAAIRFTLMQAALSALLSVGLALPLARALSRRRFRGRDLLATLLGAPFLLPVVVAVLGLLAVWGRAGWVSAALVSAGGERVSIYGLAGVLLAHVFFNLPLAARMMLQAYAAAPAERWRTAAQLGLSGWRLFRLVEAPALARAAPGALAAIFAVCAQSFAVALMLGGGPRATTVELAIYEAVFLFDLGRAALLACVQLAICLVAATALLATGQATPEGWSGEATAQRFDGWRGLDMAVIALAALFLLTPLAAAAVKGVAGFPLLDGAVFAAALRSLVVALGSTVVALALALPLAALAASLTGWRAAAAQAAGLLPIAVSPFVLGVALFLLLRPVANPQTLALPLTGLVNAVMAAPFAVAALTPAIARAHARRGRLADSLALAGLARIRVLYWPELRAPLGFAAGLAAALSAGDLGVIALFSAPDQPTLPLLMHQLAGSRRIDAGYAAAIILAVMSFGLYALFDRLGRGRA